MNPTQHFKHKSGTRHVSTGSLQLLMAEHKQLSLIVFEHFVLPHEFSIPQSSLSLQRLAICETQQQTQLIFNQFNKTQRMAFQNQLDNEEICK